LVQELVPVQELELAAKGDCFHLTAQDLVLDLLSVPALDSLSVQELV
jgi:hypothetical protein